MSAPDRELLELAARACGIEKLEFADDCPINPFQDRIQHFWNPLNEDGDALRLAVQLCMSVEIAAYESSTYAYAGSSPREYACENWADNKDAATRRAIVRAAAAIGSSINKTAGAA